MYQAVDHVAIRVKDLDAAIANYEKLGFKLERQGLVESLGIKQAIFPLGDSGSFIEIVEPTDPDMAVGRALSRYGEGIHTIALAVDDVNQTASSLKAQGVNIIGPEGDGGVAFIHPRETYGVLFQLVHRP